jgi:hypothetical protein
MSIKIDGLGKLQISLEKRTDAAVKAISETMEVNTEKMKEKIKRDSPIDRGLLRGGVESEKDGDLKFFVFSGPSQYAWIMEFGSKRKFKGNGRESIAAQFKGKPSGGTFAQFVENMYEYIKRHGWPAEVRGEKAKRNYAKFIALKIAKNGVSPANGGTGYFFKHYDRQLPIIQRSLQMAIKKFSQ